ncbi:MAG: thioester reductase domain-containing protein [Pseudonocardiales bacterium]
MSTTVKSVFLTGASGFLGTYLLHELLTSTDASLYCLVRAKDAAGAEERLRSSLSKYAKTPDSFERIIPIPGDLASVRFGLSESEYALLESQINYVIHAGAYVNHVMPRDAMEQVNVDGTRQVIRLAESHSVPVSYISTVSVFAEGIGPVSEDVNVADLPQPRLGYGQSKRAAEELLEGARIAGLPVTIFRPGRIGGDSVTGACQENDGFWMLVRVGLQIGILPVTTAEVNLTPVDFIAASVVALSYPSPRGQNFHLRNPEPATMTNVVAAAHRAGWNVELVSLDSWRRTLVEHAQQQYADPRIRLLGMMTEDILGQGEPVIQADRTHKILNSLGLICPPLGTALLDRYFGYFGS